LATVFVATAFVATAFVATAFLTVVAVFAGFATDRPLPAR